MTKRTVLDEAHDITSNDRQRYYGHPADNHGNTAALWTAFLQRKYKLAPNLTARDVCLMMALLKISRDANKTNRDNLVDVCGYIRNAEMIEEREALQSVVDFENHASRVDPALVPMSDGKPLTARAGGSEPKRLITIEDYPITAKLLEEIKAGNLAREKGHDVFTTAPSTRRSVEDFDTGPF